MGKALTNYSPKPATDIATVPFQTEFFDTWPAGWQGAISSQWLLFFEGLNASHGLAGYDAIDRVVFGLGIGAAQQVGNDLTTHGMCFTDGVLLGAYGNAKTPPSALPLYLDILRSTDQGGHWLSVFQTGGIADNNKLVIPAMSYARAKQTAFASSPYNVKVGDWWRIDLLPGSGVDAWNINVGLVWAVPSLSQSVLDIQAL
jgi:hypothetical protein